MESQAVALHAPAVRERMPSSLLNRRSAIAQLAAVMDAERCGPGDRWYNLLCTMSPCSLIPTTPTCLSGRRDEPAILHFKYCSVIYYI